MTSVASSRITTIFRAFSLPRPGVNEDPVTGSAHCCLGTVLEGTAGRDNLVGYQASARGGFVRTRCEETESSFPARL